MYVREEPEEPEPSAPTGTTEAYALDRPIDPETYVVGPGDQISVNVWGAVHQGYNLSVTPEASIIVPTVGEIDVRRMTLAQAKDAIQERLTDVYPDVPTSVTLVRIRLLRVAVAGAVKNPSIIQVTANVRASEVIDLAGWTDESSRRRILLYRAGDTLTVDAELFNRTGRDEHNPYVIEGDRIYVPQRRTQHGVIDVYGAVHLPGRFEYVPGDRLHDALQLALGLSLQADTTAVEINRFFGEDSLSTPIPVNLAQPEPNGGRQMLLHADDRVFVRWRTDYRPKAIVRVRGEVRSPGEYPIINGQTMLSEILARCGGPTERADLDKATLNRAGVYQPDVSTDQLVRSIPVELQTGPEREWILAHSLTPPGKVSINLIKLLVEGDPAYDLPLWDGDVINIPRFLPQVKVIGRVKNPGLIPYVPERNSEYYITRAGGFSWRAGKGDIFIVKASTGAPVKRDKVKKIEAGDTIVVPSKKDREFWPIFRDAMVVVGNLATLYLVIDQAVQ